MVAVAEPAWAECQFRGRFLTPYVMGKTRYQQRKKVRLMDLNTSICIAGEDGYFDPIGSDEFCVVDVVTREKAWFEWINKMEVMDVHALIEGHFGMSAFRVGPRMWFV